MTESQVEELVLRRYCLAQTRRGRMRLELYVWWKRISWRCFVRSALLVKRGFDAAASLVLLLLFSPVFLLIALLIKLEDGGPVFFRQMRVGRWGREFRMWKFRSMCLDAEEKLAGLMTRNEHHEGVTFKLKDDPRVTRVGRMLRRSSLDELPQLVNVLRGEMSLVGPRPPVPREVARYSSSDRRRLAVTPGLTCLWQIAGRSEIDFSGQVALDVQYIESQTFWGDCKILLKTIPAVLTGRGAC